MATVACVMIASVARVKTAVPRQTIVIPRLTMRRWLFALAQQAGVYKDSPG